jgi:hypothetical protein
VTLLVGAGNIDTPVALTVITIIVLATVVSIGYAALIGGGGYHGRLPWDRKPPAPHLCENRCRYGADLGAPEWASCADDIGCRVDAYPEHYLPPKRRRRDVG